MVDVVKKELVESDIFARFGGDEFAILSSVTDETALYTYLERIRKVVEAEPVMLNAETPLTLTISIGRALTVSTVSRKFYRVLMISSISVNRKVEIVYRLRSNAAR